VACAASPAGNPNVIYAGGQNNGVSSGVIKTIDGGKHWTRTSKGLWDTRILGVWVHPDDAQGKHVLAGTHSGIYESTDGAASWTFRNETTGWGNVMSFREGVIQGRRCSPSPSPSALALALALHPHPRPHHVGFSPPCLPPGRPYVLANSQDGILTWPRAVSRARPSPQPWPDPRPCRSPEPERYTPSRGPSRGRHPEQGGLWQKIAAPGGIASNAHLSVAVHGGTTEVSV